MPQGVSIMATLWAELANQDYQVGEILVIKGAKISEYGGKSLNVDASQA